jgi:hypothetical protein
MTSGSSKIYKRQLNPAGKEIRLLQLLSQNSNAHETQNRVRCQLIYCDLGEDVQYMALSYTWGDPTDTIPIEVEGIEHRATRNLNAALEQLLAFGYEMC